MRCLLYSGCDRSVISKQFVQNVKLNSPEYELFAANKTRLPVDGDTSICLTIDGRLLTAKVSVSPAVDELLLGRDWLVENGCKWDFAAGTMHIGDQLIKTHQKKNVNTCRCVFVSEECEIPQRHKVSVPVRVVLGDLKDPSTECLIDRLPADLTEEQRVHAEEFIRSRSQLFSKPEFDIGRTDVLHHRIDTGDNVPHFERLQRHPTWPMIDDHVEEMLQHDMIEPATSPWCSNVVMVRKKDGFMRFCIDYRKTNDLIKKDKFPLPKINTCLDMLNGSRFFSSCDLRQGYWQTVLDEGDRDKNAFVTRKGQWRFKVLSFGLCNAPSQFARTMKLLLSGLTYDVCLIYLDDILVFSRTLRSIVPD